MKKNFLMKFTLLSLLFTIVSCKNENHKLETIIVKEPTCTSEGLGYEQCSICKKKSNEIVIPALGHNYYVRVKEPNCTESGYTIKNCTRCGDEEKYDEKPALGHTIIDYDVPVDCENQGFTHHQCIRCGYNYDDNICAPLGHDFVITNQELTCTNDQFTKKVCRKCNYTEIENYQKALGHTYKVISHIVPSCTSEGLIKRKCEVCGHEDTEILPQVEHDLVHHEGKEPTCSESGYKPYDTCRNCSYTTYEGLEPTSNSHNYEEKIKEATTSTSGYIYKECSICHDIVIVTYIDPIKSNQIIDTKLTDHYVESFRNDDDNYFVLYGGKIKDLVLHKFNNFYWDKSIEEIDSYPRYVIEAKEAALQETFENSVNQATANVKDLLLTSQSTNFKFKTIDKSLDTSLDEECVKILKNKYNVNPFELQNENYVSLKEAINPLKNSIADENNLFKFDKTKYQYDHYYSYCAIADVNIYIGVKYDKLNNKLYYKIYTALASGIKNELYSSLNDNIGLITPQIKLDSTIIQEITKTPSDYATNHPKVIKKWEHSNGGVKSFTVSTHPYYIDLTIGGVKELYESGYDKFSMEIQYRFSSGTKAALHFQITVLGKPMSLSGKDEYTDVSRDQDRNETFYMLTSTIANDSGISINFSYHYFNPFGSYTVQYFRIIFTFYSSRATY